MDGDHLYHRIFALQKELMKEGEYTSGLGSDQIKVLIEDYLSGEPSPWVTSTTENKHNY